MYSKSLEEFKGLVEEIKSLIKKFPKNKRVEKLFGEWSLKDVIAHLSHWAEHDLNCFEALKKGEEPYWAPDIDEYNMEGVEKRKQESWDTVYSEFVVLMDKVISEYSTLREDLWDKKFWKNRKFTPRVFLDIDVDHYKNEHLPKIKEYAKS